MDAANFDTSKLSNDILEAIRPQQFDFVMDAERVSVPTFPFWNLHG